jgi:hypothetical protein
MQAQLRMKPGDPLIDLRYDDIIRSPYLFDQFTEATIIDSKLREPIRAAINFNGLTGLFEGEINGELHELDATYYAKITFDSTTLNPAYHPKFMSQPVEFLKGVIPNQFDQLFIVVHLGMDINIFKSFEVEIVEHKIEEVKRVTERKRFNPDFVYFAVSNGEVTRFQLNRKNVLSVLRNKEVSSYVKSNKISLDSEADLKRVMDYFDSVN